MSAPAGVWAKNGLLKRPKFSKTGPPGIAEQPEGMAVFCNLPRVWYVKCLRMLCCRVLGPVGVLPGLAQVRRARMVHLSPLGKKKKNKKNEMM